MHDPIILASNSAARIAMLRNAMVPFTNISARIDEEAIKSALLSEGASPRDIADMLAEMKAQRISGKNPDALVIGSDQVADLDGLLLNKPENMATARDQLKLLRGKTHKLFSAVVIVKNGAPQWRHIGQFKLTMRDFSDAYLEDYINRTGEDILNTVGGYMFEREGIRLFSRIEGDYFSILGMPLLEVLNHLTLTGALAK